MKTTIEKKLKSNKGITMIVLVITIVIILILTSVTVTSTYMGMDYKRYKAMCADIELLEEKILFYYRNYGELPIGNEVTDVPEEMDNGGTFYLVDTSKLENLTLNLGEEDDVYIVETTTRAVFYFSGSDYKDVTYYREDNIMPEIPTTGTTNEDGEEFSRIFDENTKITQGEYTAVIPKGFAVGRSEGINRIEDGLVVQAEDGNQFVWIPIKNVNDMFICQAKTATDTTCDIKIGKDANGNEYPYCELHLSTNETLAKQMAGRLYGTNNNGEGFDINLKKQTYSAEIKEPGIVTGRSSIVGTSYDAECIDGVYINLKKIKTILGLESSDISYDNPINFLNTLQNEYNKIVISVSKNQGFYVGRYETSGMEDIDKGDSIKIRKGEIPSSNLSWYTMYAYQKKYIECLELIGGMIQGAAQDQVLSFIDTETYSVITEGNVAHNWANKYAVGSKSGDESKNVCDFEGNLREWSTTRASSACRFASRC